MIDVCVLGQGHIGLPTALTIASKGLKVRGVDIHVDLITELQSGKTHLVEPGLQELLNSCLKAGTYSASTEPGPASTYIVSVPTPLNADNGTNLSYVLAAATAIAPHITRGTLVILESTVPPGTTEQSFSSVLSQISGLDEHADFHVAHCPERVLPGSILREIVENDRVVGGTTPDATTKAVEFYKLFVNGDIHRTEATTAEMVKLSENIYRDVNIGLANELAASAEEIGTNVWDVIRLANMHPRVNIHNPGPGVGGYCIPVATWMLSESLKQIPPTMREARNINSAQPGRVATLALELLAGVSNPRIALLGAAYKGDVGDARATPTTEIATYLADTGADVRVHDPHTTHYALELHPLNDALTDADMAILLTDHSEYQALDPSHVASPMNNRLIVDTRGILNTAKWEEAGFAIATLGRNDLNHSTPESDS